MGVEIARLMIAFGSVGATVGLVVIGMATSYVQPEDNLFRIGLVTMIVGSVVFVVGWLIHRAVDEPDRSTG